MTTYEHLIETGEFDIEIGGEADIVLSKMENSDIVSNGGSTQDLVQETTLTSTPIKNNDAPILHLEVPEIDEDDEERLSPPSPDLDIPAILITPEPDPIEPEDIKVPILGYDVMEARSKFTVYKIEIERSGFDRWFVFRRYNDFYQLNDKLKKIFPNFRLSLPPRRWFRSNYDREFLEERTLGLQAFLNNITGHKDICNCKEVREFFCFDDPPGPHDSLEESRALCENLEETIYVLRRELDEKSEEIDILNDEIQLYKGQVEILTKELKEKKKDSSLVAISPGSNQISLAECDQINSGTESDQSCSSTEGKLSKDERRVHFPSSEQDEIPTDCEQGDVPTDCEQGDIPTDGEQQES